MTKSPSRLGRGLSALIGTRETRLVERAPTSAPAAVPTGNDGALTRLVSIDRIQPNPHQPRQLFDETTLDELARSIRSNGILQPILIRPAGDAFQLVAGERRWRAARMAGLEAVPAIVRDLTDAESLDVALIENLQREDLGPIERATAYQHYVETFRVTVDQLAGRLAESRANIANYLRLLKLAPEIREMIARGELAMGQARAIAGIGSTERQLAVARLAARRNLSVRQVEALAKGDSARETRISEPPSGLRRHVSDIETALAKAIGLRVALHPGKRKNSGRVVIHYSSLEEFDRLAEQLGGLPPLQ